MRLNRAIASHGFCSRRKADEYILAGKVEVNGAKVRNPATHVATEDEIRIDGQLINKTRRHIYLACNKPVEVISSVKDPQGRKTVIDLLPDKYKSYRLFPVGRLDYFSEGLILLTNDGDFANLLTHPRHEHKKSYEVIIRGRADSKTLELLRKGMLLEGEIRILPIEIEETRLANGDSRLLMTLRQGLNRQIRRIAAQFGWIILKLKRIGEAGIQLGNLRPGAVRELTADEITKIKMK